jgi:DNA polymerase I-like protein with 3'-5' exonuclease and polymerase domains
MLPQIRNSPKKILFIGTSEDELFLMRFQPLLAGHAVSIQLKDISGGWLQAAMFCNAKGITAIICTSKKFLDSFFSTKTSGIDNYAGTFVVRGGIEVLFINPLASLVNQPYGEFLTRRYISKIIDSVGWDERIRATEFNWELLDANNTAGIFEAYQDAVAIAVDIETQRSPLKITEVGFTAIFQIENTYITHTSVLEINSTWALSWLRKFCWELPAGKIFQNGKYDLAWLSAYSAIPSNYLWDTQTMFHCWYSELPKDLASLGAFFIKEIIYWKDLAKSQDKLEQLKYNARDTWTTANVFLAWLTEAPQFALDNYKKEFPLLFPCHLSEMTGIKRDMEVMERARKELKDRINSVGDSLNRCLGVKNFNVNSPKQMKSLLPVLGCQDIASAGEKELAKVAYRHPLNNLLVDKILQIRGDRKLLSTYLRTNDDITKTSKGGSKEYKGRVLYSLNPHGTDTGRLASGEHHFWCGFNIQNQPRGREVKQTYVADSGFRFAEVDLEQAESRGTAFISGDEALIAAVTGTRDFHSVNASAFFGIPYEEIYDDTNKKTKNKALRDLAKRVNHGANYNMGPQVLVDTMGLENIFKARGILKLPSSWTPTKVAEHLLEQFHRTYPGIAQMYYTDVFYKIATTKMLTGATGWTRYCFGNPEKSKRDKNKYVAHCPQSLNAMLLNAAYMKVFREIAIHEDHWRNFKLCAQIHDSILFQFREGHEYLMGMVKDCMENPVSIIGCDKKERVMLVPAAIKAGKDGMGVKYWSDTE